MLYKLYLIFDLAFFYRTYTIGMILMFGYDTIHVGLFSERISEEGEKGFIIQLIYELDMNQGSGLSEKTPLVSILSAK